MSSPGSSGSQARSHRPVPSQSSTQGPRQPTEQSPRPTQRTRLPRSTSTSHRPLPKHSTKQSSPQSNWQSRLPSHCRSQLASQVAVHVASGVITGQLQVPSLSQTHAPGSHSGVPWARSGGATVA